MLQENKDKAGYSVISENEYQSSVHKDSEGQILPYRIAKDIQYPAIMISTEKVSGYLAKLVKSIMRPISEDGEMVYNIYIISGKTTIKIGKSTSVMLKILLDSDMFKEWKICAYLSENRCIEGEMLYALC